MPHASAIPLQPCNLCNTQLGHTKHGLLPVSWHSGKPVFPQTSACWFSSSSIAAVAVIREAHVLRVHGDAGRAPQVHHLAGLQRHGLAVVRHMAGAAIVRDLAAHLTRVHRLHHRNALVSNSGTGRPIGLGAAACDTDKAAAPDTCWSKLCGCSLQALPVRQL